VPENHEIPFLIAFSSFNGCPKGVFMLLQTGLIRKYPIFIAVFWTAIFCVCLVGCMQEPAKPLHIATNVWPGYEPLYLARSLGYLSETSVRLHEMSNSSDVIKAFRNREIDVAALTLDETLLLLQDGIDARIFLVMDISNGADVVMARPGIGDIKGLKGKRVGVESFATGAYMLSRALDKGGLDLRDILVVPVSLEAHEEAYLSGKVDAVVTFEPVRTRLLAKGAHIIFDSGKIPNEIFDVLVVRSDTCSSNSKELHHLEDGWYKALAYLKANPTDAWRRMAKLEGVSETQFQDSLKGLIIPDKSENQRLLSGAILPPARRLADVLLQAKLLQKPVDPATLISPAGSGRERP
jgi:NitT/TauT family transport system substrate-binding protein